MEALFLILCLAGLGVAAQVWGADTALADDREPRSSL
jgi:hypothetical protein